jgi:ethanolamine utilization microcompartment shell protein EutS
MEEKLAKLGVERPSAPPGFLPQIPVPNAFVPSHLAARAASVSIPFSPIFHSIRGHVVQHEAKLIESFSSLLDIVPRRSGSASFQA